jgi:hypothetical protein
MHKVFIFIFDRCWITAVNSEHPLGRSGSVLLFPLLALAALLGDDSSRAIIFSYVEQVALLAVDAYGEVLHGEHAVHQTTTAAEDQQRQSASCYTWAAVRRHARARRQ